MKKRWQLQAPPSVFLSTMLRTESVGTGTRRGRCVKPTIPRFQTPKCIRVPRGGIFQPHTRRVSSRRRSAACHRARSAHCFDAKACIGQTCPSGANSTGPARWTRFGMTNVGTRRTSTPLRMKWHDYARRMRVFWSVSSMPRRLLRSKKKLRRCWAIP